LPSLNKTPNVKSKTHYCLPPLFDNLHYNTSKQIILVDLTNLTIQPSLKALPEPAVLVPKQRLPDCEVWQVLALKPPLRKADLLLPVSPALV